MSIISQKYSKKKNPGKGNMYEDLRGDEGKGYRPLGA